MVCLEKWDIMISKGSKSIIIPAAIYTSQFKKKNLKIIYRGF